MKKIGAVIAFMCVVIIAGTQIYHVLKMEKARPVNSATNNDKALYEQSQNLVVPSGCPCH